MTTIRLVPMREAAQDVERSPSWLWRRVASGALPSVKRHGVVMVDPKHVRELARSDREMAAA